MSFKSLTSALLLSVATAAVMKSIPMQVASTELLAAKLTPDKLLTSGFAGYTEFNGPCGNLGRIERERYDFALSHCYDESGNGNPKVKSAKRMLQTYKRSTTVDFMEQRYTDMNCKKKLGKPVKVGRFNLNKCYDSDAGSLTYSYHPKLVPVTLPGLVVTQFKGATCGGAAHKNPILSTYLASFQCINTTIGNNENMNSVIVYADYGYGYEYSEPNCAGSSMPIYFNSFPNNCQGMGSHSALYTVNRAPTNPPVMSPTYAPVVSYPTPAPVQDPMYTYFPTESVDYATYVYHTVYVSENTTGVDLVMASLSGDCDIYASTNMNPSASMYSWKSTSGMSPEYLSAMYPCGAQGGCELYVGVYGFTAGNCQLGYKINW